MFQEDFVIETDGSKLSLSLNYGSITNLHLTSMKFNPLSLYIIRTSHNRNRDINTKYVNVEKGQMIQLLVPSESKSFYNIQSKPKYGKLYFYNVYKSGDVRI